jgi:hypothetical protein
MDIKRVGTQPSTKGRRTGLPGTVRVDPLADASDPARILGGSVTFDPGARIAWPLTGWGRHSS